MSRDEYAAYLRSPWWQRVRRVRIHYADFTCNRCGYRQESFEPSDKRLEVHHLTYKHLGAEWPWELEVLCEDCHAAHHELPPRPRPVCGNWWPVRAVLTRVGVQLFDRMAAYDRRVSQRLAQHR